MMKGCRSLNRFIELKSHDFKHLKTFIALKNIYYKLTYDVFTSVANVYNWLSYILSNFPNSLKVSLATIGVGIKLSLSSFLYKADIFLCKCFHVWNVFYLMFVNVV